MSETEEWDSSTTPKPATKIIVNYFSITPHSPSEGPNEKGFACPLCVDSFRKFSQLKWHLQSMHPRREMIMKLVHERHGIPQKELQVEQSQALESQYPQQGPSISCTQAAAENLVPVAVGARKCSSEHHCAEKMTASDDRSSWDSYLSYCLSN